ncbi:MAG: PH domain-containing protein [Candidatus Micrarchaeota archaeon]
MPEEIHPNPIAQIVVLILFGILISFVMSFLFGRADFFGGVLIILWGFFAVIAAYAFLITRFISLDVSDGELIYRRGMFSIQRMHIPFRKITGLFMNQTFVERIFGLGTLEVDTAGGPFAEIVASAMPYKALERIVEEIKRETDRDEHGEAPPPPKSAGKPAKPVQSKQHQTMYR